MLPLVRIGEAIIDSGWRTVATERLAVMRSLAIGALLLLVPDAVAMVSTTPTDDRANHSQQPIRERWSPHLPGKRRPWVILLGGLDAGSGRLIVRAFDRYLDEHR